VQPLSSSKAGLEWLNKPPSATGVDGVLTVVTGDRTDFWRETHYGFIRDDGHFGYRRVAGDFTATVSFRGEYRTLYDQAGMMVRLDERNWIKAGIEFVGGQQMLSVVVTRDYSDWSTSPMPGSPEWVTLRCARHGSAIRIEWRAGDGSFQLIRLAYLPERDPTLVGAMCCSPERAGFRASFRDFAIGPPTTNELHAS
jgi:regulation of enolase protein 1 (concanavalin A-like superfamily)